MTNIHRADLNRIVFALIFILAHWSPVSAEIPQIINYQGKITESYGAPVVDDDYIMKFSIYDAETGGTLMWDGGWQWVAVEDGYLHELLGQNPYPPIDLAFDQDYWLLVNFEGEDLLPRKRLGSVGYAYMASGLVAGTEVSGAVNTGTNSVIKATNTSTTGTVNGICGSSTSTEGRGVYGEATATSGFNYGGYFTSASISGAGVYGVATDWSGYTSGVYGLAYSTNGSGVYGFAFHNSGSTYGVWGQSASTSGVGVYGRASDTTGTGITTGVYGECFSTNGRAVFGGSVASVGPTHGVWGVSNSTTGYGVYYSGGLAGSGSKSCVVKTSQGPTLMYCQESPENWFEDFGEGRLVNGRCHIELDPLFRETVTVDAANPMMVFVELGGKCEGVYVEKGLTGFDVIELHDGGSNVAFDYRVVAKRKGFESKRMDYCKAGETDYYLHSELMEKWIQEREGDRARMEKERERMEVRK